MHSVHSVYSVYSVPGAAPAHLLRLLLLDERLHARLVRLRQVGVSQCVAVGRQLVIQSAALGTPCKVPREVEYIAGG